MTDFNIDQYEITVTLDDNKEDLGVIKPKLYPDLSDTECTVTLEKKIVPFSDWIIETLTKHRLENPAKIAIIEEIGDVRCVTYEELMDGTKRTANYMRHHGVKSGDRILMCMENSVEYIFYQLGAFLMGAVPILVNPSHITSEKVTDLDCTSAIVDFEHYGPILRISQSSLRCIQRVFVLADDIAAISLPRHVWIIDGFGFLSFAPHFHKSIAAPENKAAFLLPSQKLHQYIAHSPKSAYLLCHDYFDQLFDKLLSSEDTKLHPNHLITSGLHCHDAFSYLYNVFAKGETCVLAESTLDVWRASFLDRIAGIIEQYKVPLLISNSQLLKCFIKYEVHKIYDLKSLKLIANHGSALAVSTGKKLKKILDVILIQAYSSPEFGIASYGIFDETSEDELVNCGLSVGNMQVKIADLETEKEVSSGEFGQIILSGGQAFDEYHGNDKDVNRFMRNWFKTQDFGKIDENGKLHFEGPISDLIRVQGKQISSELLECVLCHHKLVEDVVVMQNQNELWCGVLLKDENNIPTREKLEKVLKKHSIHMSINKVVVLDFIPRTENGKLMRPEIPYLMNSESSEKEEEMEATESYI